MLHVNRVVVWGDRVDIGVGIFHSKFTVLFDEVREV
jgi:hypothetical protein